MGEKRNVRVNYNRSSIYYLNWYINLTKHWYTNSLKHGYAN